MYTDVELNKKDVDWHFRKIHGYENGISTPGMQMEMSDTYRELLERESKKKILFLATTVKAHREAQAETDAL
jgi:hypothetical protein